MQATPPTRGQLLVQRTLSQRMAEGVALASRLQEQRGANRFLQQGLLRRLTLGRFVGGRVRVTLSRLQGQKLCGEEIVEGEGLTEDTRHRQQLLSRQRKARYTFDNSSPHVLWHNQLHAF